MMTIIIMTIKDVPLILYSRRFRGIHAIFVEEQSSKFHSSIFADTRDNAHYTLSCTIVLICGSNSCGK